MNGLRFKQKLMDWAYELFPYAMLLVICYLFLYSCVSQPVSVSVVAHHGVSDEQYWALKRLEQCDVLYAKNWLDLSDDEKMQRTQCDEWRKYGYPL